MTEETFKGGVHVVAGTLAAVMLAYSAMRWCVTRKPRNAVNMTLYAPLWWYEMYQAFEHWQRRS